MADGVLRDDAFDKVSPTFCRAMPDGLDRVIRWRIPKVAGFFHAIESNHHNAFRWITFEGHCSTGTNEIVTAERR